MKQTRLIDGRPVVISLVSFTTGLFIFALALFSLINQSLLFPLNQPVMDFMLSIRNDATTAFAVAVTTIFSSSYVVLMITAIVAVWFIAKKEVLRPAVLVFGMAISTMTSYIMKIETANLRPSQLIMMRPFELDYSFPSGHTMTAVVFLLLLGYLAYSRDFKRVKYYGWLTIALILSTLVALSRLYLGYHWLTDVTASFGLGLVVFSITILIDRILLNNTKLT